MSEPASVRPVVSVVVVDAARRVLLFPTAGPSGVVWSVPTGDVGPGEDPAAAARRVVETATSQAVSQVVPIEAPGERSKPRAEVFFLCRAEAFRVRRGDQTLSGGQWWSLEQLPAAVGLLPLADLVALVKRNT